MRILLTILLLPRTIFFLATICLLSCTQGGKVQPAPTGADSTVTDTTVVVKDAEGSLPVHVNNFSEIDSSGILVFPLAIGASREDGGSLEYRSKTNYGFWNIIFYNSKTNAYHLLSERKMLIRSYDLKYSSMDQVEFSQDGPNLFYSITVDDYDKDKELTTEDPRYLFISDKEGKNFRQVSPAYGDVQNWRLIESSGKLIMTVKKDTNSNNRYDDDDEVTTFEVDMVKGAAAREVFAPDFKNKLKGLFNRDWKRSEK